MAVEMSEWKLAGHSHCLRIRAKEREESEVSEVPGEGYATISRKSRS